MEWGIHWRKLGATSGIMPTPMDTATIMALLRLSLKSTVAQDADAGGGHHAEHHQAGAAQHHGGQGLDQRAHLGQHTQHDQNDPPATQTQRLLTPVTATRPTFCEKLV